MISADWGSSLAQEASGSLDMLNPLQFWDSFIVAIAGHSADLASVLACMAV
jgi:hypothetical protein